VAEVEKKCAFIQEMVDNLSNKAGDKQQFLTEALPLVHVFVSSHDLLERQLPALEKANQDIRMSATDAERQVENMENALSDLMQPKIRVEEVGHKLKNLLQNATAPHISETGKAEQVRDMMDTVLSRYGRVAGDIERKAGQIGMCVCAQY
jgi:uncharacterized membrane protein YheB (UPF0754 family)